MVLGGRVKLRVQGPSMAGIFTDKPRDSSYREGESTMEAEEQILNWRLPLGH